MEENENLITLTADIVSAHVSNNTVAVGDIATLVQRVHEALASLTEPKAAAEPDKKIPVVSVRASVKPDFVVCMECGRKQKTLRRHLQTAHGMTPDQYRRDYGLPDSYPMTAPNYSKRRQEMAHAIGLGRKRTTNGGGTGSSGAGGGASEAGAQPQRKRRTKRAK